jgi:hypothetical protein
MFCEYMFSCYLFLFILLFSTSSMFEVVAGFVIFNIIKLIMEIVPNYPTLSSRLNAPKLPSLLINEATKSLFTKL